MARIKVTAFVETDDLKFEEVDLGDDSGLTEAAFVKYQSQPYRLPLAEPEFELVAE